VTINVAFVVPKIKNSIENTIPVVWSEKEWAQAYAVDMVSFESANFSVPTLAGYIDTNKIVEQMRDNMELTETLAGRNRIRMEAIPAGEKCLRNAEATLWAFRTHILESNPDEDTSFW
jgi:hypothetical protein